MEKGRPMLEGDGHRSTGISPTQDPSTAGRKALWLCLEWGFTPSDDSLVAMISQSTAQRINQNSALDNPRL